MPTIDYMKTMINLFFESLIERGVWYVFTLFVGNFAEYWIKISRETIT